MQGKSYLNCPECDTQNIAHDGVNSFPKNLVLLQMNGQNIIPSNKQANNSDLTKQNEQNQQQSTQEQTNSNNSHRDNQQKQKSNNTHDNNNVRILCNYHGKKLEAFCEKDLQVLCIDCILSDAHKSHEIISVQKAADKQRQFLYEEVSTAQKTEEKLKFILSDIKRHVSDLHSTADKNRKELSQIYSYIRDLILEREQTLKRQISENLTKEEMDCEDKQSEINEFIGGIGQLKQELLNQNEEHDIDILLKAKSRQAVASEINGLKARELILYNIQNVAGNSLSLQEIKRDQELTQISRIIGPNYKGPTIGQTIGQTGQQSNLYSHTASTANKMKKANTQGQTQMSCNFPGGINSQNPFNLQNDKSQKEELRKQGKSNHNMSTQNNSNQVKSKVSPHRVQPKKGDISNNQNKKVGQGVMILDQNKQKSSNTNLNKNSNKCQGSFGNMAMQNQINLHNYNQYGHHQQNTQPALSGQQDDMGDDILGNIGPEDVSSIYPLETNDCYYQYQDNLQRNHYNKRDESVANLNDLLESLNKSSGQQEINLIDNDKVGTSTASETGGSHSDIKTPPPQDFKFQKTKSSIESPRTKKINAWKNQPVQQKNKSNKKNNFKKDNSTTDLDDVKAKHAKLIQLHQNDNQQFLPLEETKNDIRPGSLQRYGSNALFQNEQPSSTKKQNYKGALKFDDSETKILNSKQITHQSEHITHQLCSLSQERAKRKQQKMGVSSQEQSPFKLKQVNDTNNIMELLQECTKNIDKLEFKHNQNKQASNKIDNSQDSPVKQTNQSSTKAAVCVVDLTRRDDIEEFNVRKNDDKDQIINYNEEEEGMHSKNLPNMTKPKDQSPLKQSQILQQKDYNRTSTSNSPNKNKQPVLQSTESLDNLMLNAVKNQDNSFEISKNNQLSIGTDNLLHQSVSVDTSISDPFRAFCKIKEEFIFVFSGFNDQKLLTCEALDVQRGTWKEICQIGKARTKFSAVPISKSRILIFGGKQADGQRTGEIEEYNLKTNKFKTLPFKLPKPRSGFSACVKREEGKIFFCGGNSGSVLKKFDCLDLKKGKWSRWPEMIQKRDELAVALGPDGKIYAIGGYGGGSNSNSNPNSSQQKDLNNLADETKDNSNKNQSSNCLRTAERFDFATGEWEMLPEMNEARRALAAVALPDGIYAIGGYDGKQYLSSVEKFDLQKQQWIPVKPMNTSRCTLSAVVSSDCQYIYAIGGFNGNSLDLVERYNTMTDEWEFITPMNNKRFMHEAVCLVTH